MSSVIATIGDYLHKHPALLPGVRKHIQQLRDKEQTDSVYFLRDKQNAWWFLGIYSNKFVDRYHTILSSDAHQRFSDFLDRSGFQPALTLWHEPRMSEEFWLSVWNNFHDDIPLMQSIVDGVYRDIAFAKVEKTIYTNGFAIVAARVFPDKYEVAEKLSQLDDLGMSHGFVTGILDDNIIDSYFSFEMTVLPRARAGNLATSGSLFNKVGEKSIMPMEPAKKEWLEDFFGSGIVEKLETRTKGAEEALELLLSFKDDGEDHTEMDDTTTVAAETQAEETPEVTPVTEEAPATEDVVEAPEQQPVTMQQMLDFLNPLKEVLEGIAADVREAKADAKEAKDATTALSRDVSEVRQTDDQKIAATIAPQTFWGSIGGYRASESPDTVVEAETPAPAPKLPEAANPNINPFGELLGLALRGQRE
jgi:hypothetical protein